MAREEITCTARIGALCEQSATIEGTHCGPIAASYHSAVSAIASLAGPLWFKRASTTKEKGGLSQ